MSAGAGMSVLERPMSAVFIAAGCRFGMNEAANFMLSSLDGMPSPAACRDIPSRACPMLAGARQAPQTISICAAFPACSR
jgi:hypothetical protein